jgi:3-oxoadipate enol-lactonase
MPHAAFDGIALNYRLDGDPTGTALVFANSLGTNLTMWDPIMDLMPESLKILRYDMRGHGQSQVPDPPYSMGALVRDIEQLLDMLEIRNCLFVGLSVGGLVAQGLSVKRLDLVRAVVLSNTGAKIGTAEIWDGRINMIREGGLEAVVDATMERWFTKKFRQSPEIEHWSDMMLSTPVDGYTGCAEAIKGTDFYTPTSGLRLPTLGIAGSDDGATPPDLVRETVDLVPGSEFALIRKAGHLPHVEQPEEYARLLIDFMKKTGHLD